MIFQPPPPPPDAPSWLALGPMTLMIGITFLMQAVIILTSSFVIREYRGVRVFFLSTLFLSAGFFLILFHPQFGFAIGITSNIAIYTGNMLMYLAICQFTEKPPQRWILYGLIPLGYFALLLTFFLRIPINAITELANIPLSAASAYTLIRSNNKTFRLSAYLTAFPLFLYALVSLIKMITAIVSPAEIAPGQTATNSLSILIVYILSFLWVGGFIFMISQRLQFHLNELAMNDMLTRVRNRRAMHELLDYELRRAERRVKDFSVILLDVDHFKRVNDTYGHDTGDEVLKWIATNLQASARIEDTVSRWGGEEFLILLPATALDEAVDVAERMRAHIESATFAFKDVTVKITFSAGVSCSKEHPDVDELCKIADQALYLAKRTRNRVISQEQIIE
ncbi:MAG TPA: GGDEF domain-containing protein [Anaerolineales bacterium]|nr:GGDEF domain-containing protein [Anaerolineales bacterium]